MFPWLYVAVSVVLIAWQAYRVRAAYRVATALAAELAIQRAMLHDSSLIGTFFHESEGRISDANDALLDMLGMTPAEFQHEAPTWIKLIGQPPDFPAVPSGLVPDKSQRATPFETVFTGKDGSAIPVLISRAGPAMGRPDRGVAFVVDLRRTKHAEDALRHTETELRALNESLERRVRDRTTEIEAQSVRLRALALDLTKAESRERKRLAQILHDHFQQLISAAKMKIGIIRRRSPDSPEIDALRQTESLLEEALEASRSLATELSPPLIRDAGLAIAFEWLARRMRQNHNLIVQLDIAGCPEPDNEQICTILFECARELLFNVVKHAGVESAELNVSMPQDGLLQVRIVDQGKGFDSLAETSRRPDGSLGLFSIRERLSLLGGLIKIVSAPGRGTTVEMTVPVTFRPATAPIKIPAAVVKSAPHPAADPRPMRILVADDHKLFRDGLISVLRQEPYLNVIAEAEDGQMALELAREHHPDIMIVDITMPRLNGIQLTATISSELPAIKVVGLSMHESDEMSKAMRNAGAVAYCAKSEPLETIINILRDLKGMAPVEAVISP